MYKRKAAEGEKRNKRPLTRLNKGKRKTCEIPRTHGIKNQQTYILNTWNGKMREEK
jgi:hypothetical protein